MRRKVVIYMHVSVNSQKLERKIAALKSGDVGAFDYIYEHTNRSVYFAVLYIVRDRMHAEDVLQETYVRAIRSINSYEAGTNFTAWLTRIGRNLALNFVGRAKRETPVDFAADERMYGACETELPYIFDIAAKVLSEEEYEIVMLCQVAGYKRREAAEMLNMPLGTVTWKNNEALKKLKNHLQKEGGI